MTDDNDELPIHNGCTPCVCLFCKLYERMLAFEEKCPAGLREEFKELAGDMLTEVLNQGDSLDWLRANLDGTWPAQKAPGEFQYGAHGKTFLVKSVPVEYK